MNQKRYSDALRKYLHAHTVGKRSLLLLMVMLPLTAYPQSLSDYLNSSTVTASTSQFESDTDNNTDSVQITPNAEIVLVKKIINDDGGVAVLSDFGLGTDAGTLNFDSGTTVGITTTYTSDTLYVPPGVYSLEELDIDGYAEGTWDCDVGVMGSTAFDSGSVELAFGEQTTCTIINDDITATLTLAKTVVNDNGGLLTDADFDLSVDGTVVANGVATAVDANTAITISELDVPGYTEGTWSCVDANNLTIGLPTAGLATGESITLASGSDVTCSISNDDIAPTLSLAKTIVNDDGGLLVIDDFDISIDGTEVTNGVANTVLANSAIIISELDVDGYTAGTWACSDASGLTSGLPTAGTATGTAVELVPGAVVSCEISNDDIAPTLTLSKTLINDNGGSNVIDDFDISIDGTEVLSGVATTLLANTPVVISELDLPGYTEGTWACTDANSLTSGLPAAGTATGQSITLALGADVNCAIVNDDLAPSLTLVKTVINDDGGDLTIDDFDISVDGTEVISGANTVVASNTDIVISELALDGYTEGSWSCVDVTGLTSGLPTAGLATSTTIQLAEGAVVSCEISNDDIAPTLVLSKTVVNDDGGLLIVDDFDISVDTVEVPSGAVNTVLANTDILISELDVPGYTEGTWSCSDANALTSGLPTAGTATGTTLSLKQGSDVTCEISNDDIAPTLMLTKTLLNDNGGDLAIDDFDISIDGTEVVSGVVNTVQANIPILVSELALPGYTAGTWACNDTAALTTGLPTAGAAVGTSVSLLPGSAVECEIINDDIAPLLTLTKSVINDHGGDKIIDDFDISIDGTEVISGAANTMTSNVGILISELALPGYSSGSWACTDAQSLTTGLPVAGVATGEIITLKQGSDVTCAISNDDIQPLLTLVKTVVNDNGGDQTIEDFDISIDGTEVISGASNPVLANTTITISELDLVPYAEGTWSCTDINGITTGLPAVGTATSTSLTLLPGSDVTCEITNNDLGIDLTIAKTVDDNTPNIGQVIEFELVVSNAGPDIATNVTVTDPIPAGFTYVGGSITGGDASIDTDPTGTGLTWTINSIPVGAPVTLSFQAIVNAP